MEINDIVMALGGSIFGSFSTFFFQKKREKRDDFTTLINEHKELYKQMKENYTETKQEENKCAETLHAVGMKMAELEQEIYKLKNK